MPPTLTYPGVYIEELPSGVNTITGVATSIAAFVGWAPMGSVTEAVLVESWSDFGRLFGGLSSGNYLGYSVNQFFGNGGQQAYIVRLVATNADTPTASSFAATASGIVSTLTLFASSPGQWGNDLQITVTPSTLDPTRFSILVQLVSGGTTTTLENFSNLSVSPTDPQYVITVIDSDSNYITFIDPTISPPTIPPPPTLPGLTASGMLGTSTVGADGEVLVPATDGNFELALLSAMGGVGINLLTPIFFNLLCVPGEINPSTVKTLQTYCAGQRAFYIVDAPQLATIAGLNTSGPAGSGGVTVVGPDAANAAYYFPWVQAPDPLAGNRTALFPPCGFVAGIYAATDASRGVWKAPAGVDAGLSGELGLQYVLTDQQNGDLNVQAINCLREFKVYGDVVWGARTLAGNAQAGSQWMYVPIKRLALYLESSLYQGTQWVVFEPNDERLWSQIRLNVGSFMQGLFLQGAFQGTLPQQAYFVKCDSENNPQSSIDMGIVNILVGFAPLYPAEFVVIQIQQMAGQTQS
jgi:phage tail sheath protein FI